MALGNIASWFTLTPWRVGTAGVVVLALVVLGYGLIEARTLRVSTAEIRSADLPKEFDGTRVVFLADIHAGRYFGDRRMEALVERVNDLEPDVLILGGDYVGGQANGARVFYPRAADFEARLAKIAVMGNHDIWEGSKEARRRIVEDGFQLLENKNTLVTQGGASIAVAGVDDLYTGDPNPEVASAGIDPDAFSILVSHNPDVFADRLGATAGRWNLGLAGHTHAGQLTLFGAFALFVPSQHGQRYRTGWVTEETTPILVTNGVGSVTIPVRLFARPEIHLITLRSEVAD